MKIGNLRNAAALALVVLAGTAAFFAFFAWFPRNPLLGKWKALPNQWTTDCGSTKEIDFDKDKVTFVTQASVNGNPDVLTERAYHKAPATYTHDGNRYLVKRPDTLALVFVLNTGGIIYCGANLSDNDCFNGCSLVPAN